MLGSAQEPFAAVEAPGEVDTDRIGGVGVDSMDDDETRLLEKKGRRTHSSTGEIYGDNDDEMDHGDDEDEAFRMPARRSRGRLPRDAIVLPGSDDCCLKPCLGGRQIGKILVLVERRGAGGRPEFVCVIPACWPMLCITEALICGLSLACYIAYFPYVGWFWIMLGVLSLGFVSTSLALAGCSDPGIEPRRTEMLDENWVWDETAQSYRPNGVQYCFESQVLVRDLDHFCPWTGTTIAGGNIRYFYSFIIGLFVQIMVLLAVVLAGNSAKYAHHG